MIVRMLSQNKGVENVMWRKCMICFLCMTLSLTGVAGTDVYADEVTTSEDIEVTKEQEIPELLLNQWNEKTITTEDGSELYAFHTPESEQDYYYIEIVNTSQSDITYEVSLDKKQKYILDAKEQYKTVPLAETLSAGKNSRHCMGVLMADQTYYIHVSGKNQGRVKLLISSVTDEVGSTGGSGRTLKMNGKTQSSSIENYEDKDCFSFSTTGLEKHILQVKNMSNSGTLRVRIYVNSKCTDIGCVYSGYVQPNQTKKIHKLQNGSNFGIEQDYYVLLTAEESCTYALNVKATGPDKVSLTQKKQKIKKAKAKSKKSKKKKGSTKKATSATRSVKISWEKNATAKGYKVYCSTSAEGNYRRIAKIKGKKKVQYVHKKRKVGKKYYYYVVAYDAKHNSSTKSVVKSIKINK